MTSNVDYGERIVQRSCGSIMSNCRGFPLLGVICIARLIPRGPLAMRALGNSMSRLLPYLSIFPLIMSLSQTFVKNFGRALFPGSAFPPSPTFCRQLATVSHFYGAQM